jgi:hypothetical protein
VRRGGFAVVLAALTLAACGGDGGSGEGSGGGGDAPAPPSRVPSGAVAVVGDEPITKEALDRAIGSRVTGVSPLNGRAKPPRLRGKDQPDPEDQRAAAADSVLSSFLQQQWAISQAAAEKITVPDAVVDSTLEQYRAAAGDQYEPLLRKSGLTADDVRYQVRAQLSQQALVARRAGDAADGDPKAAARTQVELQNELVEKWRPRTLCVKAHVVPECSNGPKPQPIPVP